MNNQIVYFVMNEDKVVGASKNQQKMQSLVEGRASEDIDATAKKYDIDLESDKDTEEAGILSGFYNGCYRIFTTTMDKLQANDKIDLGNNDTVDNSEILKELDKEKPVTFEQWLCWACRYRAQNELYLLPELKLADGMELSAQASADHMCSPREMLDYCDERKYDSIELYTHGEKFNAYEFPNLREISDSTYGYVSINDMELICKRHGGAIIEQ